MKRKFILGLSLFFTMSLSVSAFAAENTTDNYKSYAGITPGSIFYSLDQALDNLSIKLASSPSDKVEKLLQIERERLGEIQTLIDDKKVDLGVETLDSLKALADQTSTEINSILTDSSTSGDEAAKVDEVVKDAENFNTNSADTLNALKDKLPQNAAQKVAAAAEMQTAKKEAVKQMVTAIHELNTAKKAVNTAKKALDDATKSGDAAAIEKATADLNAANTVLAEKKTALDTARKNKSEVIKNTKLGNGHKKNTTTTTEDKDTSTDTDENTTSTGSTTTTAPAAGTTDESTNTATTDTAPAESAPAAVTDTTSKVTAPATIKAETVTTESTNKNSNDKAKNNKANNGNAKNADKKNHNK